MSSFDLGVYEHFKSTEEDPKRYKVLALTNNAETDEPMVLYSPLYSEEAITIGGTKLYVRSLRNLTEQVEYNGQHVPRFSFIGSTIEE